MLQDNQPFAADLCLSCGLCCTGEVFTYAPLRSNEVSVTTWANLSIYRYLEGLWVFQLPCPYYQGNCCSIHPLRPRVCSDYRCKLLRKYMSEEVDWDAAQDIVHQTKRVAADILNQISAGDIVETWQQIRNLDNLSDLEWKRSHANLVLLFAQLNALLKRYFL